MTGAQVGLFGSVVYKWPCRWAGARSRPAYPPDAALRSCYRARSRPVLSQRWVLRAASEGTQRLELHWLHPSPLTRADYEYDRVVAVSINPDGCRWTVRWLVPVNRDGFSPWSHGQSTGLEAAKADTLTRLRARAPRLLEVNR